MRSLEPILRRQPPPGIYRYRSRARPDSVLEALARVGWHGFYVDGSPVVDKMTFLAAWAEALDFPDYVALNWDAFEEAVRDLTWVPAEGYVVLWDHAAGFLHRAPADWVMARAILGETIAFWQELSVPFYVLMRRAGHRAMALDRVP